LKGARHSSGLSECPLYPQSRHQRHAPSCLLWATLGLMRRSEHCELFDHLVGAAEHCWRHVRPSALAVVKLITSSNLTGAWTGSSLGFAPLRIRSAYEYEFWYESLRVAMSLVGQKQKSNAPRPMSAPHPKAAICLGRSTSTDPSRRCERLSQPPCECGVPHLIDGRGGP
jgi:hypothetical protein